MLERREPIAVAAGDTIEWCRWIPEYSSGTGCFLDYEIRGADQPISFQSTPAQDNIGHRIIVAAGVSALWLPCDAYMAGYAVNPNAAPPTRERIYYGELKIALNLQGTPGDVPVTTLAQRMLAKIEAVMEGTASQTILESRIGETMFKFLTPEQLVYWHGYWACKRRNERQMERAHNGQDTGQHIGGLASITPPGAVTGTLTFRGLWG